MRTHFAFLLASLSILTACSSAAGGSSSPVPNIGAATSSRAAVHPRALVPVAAAASYASGTITIVNASASAQDLSAIEVTFSDPDSIASFWGSPWMAWQAHASGGAYVLTGGTAYATWAKGAALTISFTPPAQNAHAPSNVRVYTIPSPALTRCSVTATESAGTISIVNGTKAAIPLRRARLSFEYPAAIANVWGTPWMAWTAVRAGNRYTLTGGTHNAATLASGATLTASFTPASGAHATSIAFVAACASGPPPSPTPSPSPTPVPSATPKPTPTPVPTATPTAPPGGVQFVGFWESWSDTNTSDAYNDLKTVPPSVTTTDVAFSIANDNTIAPVQNYYPLLPGAQAIHAHGGKLLLSFGGATSQFQITSVATFVANLQAFMKANPGLYDGFDFDDEVMPWNGQQQLISIINAVRAAFPHAVITFDGFMSGGDPQVALSTHQGEDVAVIQQAGAAIDYVNVMDYDQYNWHPTQHPACSFTPGSSDDCRLDVLRDFAAIRMPGGAAFGTGKVVMGLMIGSADDGAIVSPSDASSYAAWIRSHGYRGVMIWDIDRDNPQGAPDGTGHPKGTYVEAISTALGT